MTCRSHALDLTDTQMGSMIYGYFRFGKDHNETWSGYRDKKFLKDQENPDDGDKKLWVDHVLQANEKLTNKHTMTVENQPMYKGELEQAHGKAEAADFIRRGKFVAKKEKDGDTVYVKRNAVEKFEKEHEESVSGTRYQ